MNISVKTSYALHAIFDLATQPLDQPVKIADIARRQEIPQKFLELILASLKQGGFVESRRGAEGGYRLAKPPDHLTVGQVLRFVEQTRTPSFTYFQGQAAQKQVQGVDGQVGFEGAAGVGIEVPVQFAAADILRARVLPDALGLGIRV